MIDFQKIKTDLIKEETLNLLKANNKVTTLEVKLSLMSKCPAIFWKQKEVSDVLKEMADNEDLFVSSDTGTHRIYSLVDSKPMPYKPKVIDVLEKSKGKFITISFIKKNGDYRVMNCKFIKTSLPYALVLETKSKTVKNVNIDTVKNIKFDKTEISI